MRNASLRILLGVLIATLSMATAQQASAQDEGADPGNNVGAPGAPTVPAEAPPAVPSEIEEELEEEAEAAADPEPEVSEPEPEVSAPVTAPAGESADELGVAETRVEDDLRAAEGEGEEAATPTPRRRRGGPASDGEEELSTSSRLASANPTAGLPWSAPFTFSPSLTVRTLTPEGQLTYNPNVSTWYSIRPRWNFTPALSLGFRQDLSVQLTASEITHNRREMQWGDSRFDLTYQLPWKPGGLLLIPSLNLWVPSSKFSRVMNRYAGMGATMLIMRANPVLNGFITGIQLGYLGWAGGSNTPTIREDGENGAPVNCRGANSTGATELGRQCNPDAGDALANKHTLTLAIFGTLIPADGWQINLSFVALPARNYDLAEACLGGDVVTANGEQLCLEENNDNHWNWTTSYSMSVGYDVAPYMTLSLGYSTTAIHPDSDGSIEKMFFNEFSTFSLGLQFRPSAFYVHVTRDEEEDAEEEGEEGDSASRRANPIVF